jgi:hypothetical protein
VNKCPKCQRPKAEGAKFCRACYAVFGAPGGFTAVSRHNRDAKIASFLIQLFIFFLASMAVWLIQTDFSFIKTARWRVQQTFAEARRSASGLADAGSASSGQVASNEESKATENEGSVKRCDDDCPETSSSVGGRPPQILVKIGPGPVKQQETTVTLMSEILACPADRVCQGTVRFNAGEIGEYSVVGSSTQSSLLVATNRHASELLRTFSRGTLEVKLDDGRIRTLRIIKRGSGKWRAVAKPEGSL